MVVVRGKTTDGKNVKDKLGCICTDLLVCKDYNTCVVSYNNLDQIKNSKAMF